MPIRKSNRRSTRSLFRASIDALEQRRLLASVSGTLYRDFDRDGVMDLGETGIGGIVVYADANNNGNFDTNERSTLSQPDGTYTLDGLSAGLQRIRVVLPDGWSQVPAAGTSLIAARSADGSSVSIDTSGLQKTSFLEGEVIVSVVNRARFDDALRKLANRSIRGSVNLLQAGTLGESDGETLLQIPLTAGQDPESVAKTLSTLAGVAWAEPNFVYTAAEDPAEYIPNDPSFSQQYSHTKMQTTLAWDITKGEGVKIGIADGGFLMNHPDLVPNYWVNPGEIAGNGIDDDGNGYIDDVSGWDFTRSTSTFKGDNDPSPADADADHGTHVAGIAAARMNNGIGVAGTAGLATIVPLRFAGSGSWTSTVIYNTYKYAADNGVKIVSTSYGVDGFASSSTYISALNYMYTRGVLHLNSAGNDTAANSARQRLDQSLYVASVNSSDVKAGTSNWGFGVDLAAPGVSIYATAINATTGNPSYETKSGTSMATPNAAGVAALIWSKNPTWTRDQVAAQLLGTTDNIDALNPNFATLMGTGRANSYRAVTQTLGAPKFREVLGLPANGTTVASAPTTIRVRFFNVLDATAANNLANWKLVSAGPDDVFGTADDVNRSITLTGTTGTDRTYRVGTNEFNFNINGTLPDGRYRFIAVSGGTNGLKDPFGTALDGNADGTGGDDFVREFRVGANADANAHVVVLGEGDAVTGKHFGLAESIGPKILEAAFDFETAHVLRFQFDESLAPLQGNASIQIIGLPAGTFIDVESYTATFDESTFLLTLEFNEPLADSNYHVQLLANGIRDRFNNRLDGNGDGNAGDSFLFQFHVLSGDANRDRIVNFDDLLILAQNYGTSGKTFSQGNFDYSVNGTIDFDDLLILAQRYGTTLNVVAIETSKDAAAARKRTPTLEILS